MATDPSEAELDRGTRLILSELRDLRIEMRDDRRQAHAERQRMDEERRRMDEERQRKDEERRLADEAGRQALRDALRELREDSIRQAAETRQAWRDVRAVGLSIVKTLNHHTRLLRRIDAKLGRWPGGPPADNGGRA